MKRVSTEIKTGYGPRPKKVGGESVGASGRRGTELLKENPYGEFRLRTVPMTYLGSDIAYASLRLALFLLEGYSWECRNSDRVRAVHSELPRAEALRDRIAWLVAQHDDKEGKFWPLEDEWTQLALVEYAMLLPSLWD